MYWLFGQKQSEVKFKFNKVSAEYSVLFQLCIYYIQ